MFTDTHAYPWLTIPLLKTSLGGIGLLGVGVITLAGQAARKHFRIGVDGFWTVVGILFLAGGVWELADIEFSMVPFLLIVAGAAVLASAFRIRRE